MVRRLEGLESVADTITIERQCDREFLEPLAKTANDYNAILSTDCGAGVQFLAEHFEEKIVLPGLNTSFIGVTEVVGVWGVDPPKGADLSALSKKSGLLKGRVDAINLSDNSQAVMRMCPLAASCLIKEKRVELILNVACRDRNRLALESDLLGVSALGIHNILCVTSDHVATGDHLDGHGKRKGHSQFT